MTPHKKMNLDLSNFWNKPNSSYDHLTQKNIPFRRFRLTQLRIPVCALFVGMRKGSCKTDRLERLLASIWAVPSRLLNLAVGPVRCCLHINDGKKYQRPTTLQEYCVIAVGMITWQWKMPFSRCVLSCVMYHHSKIVKEYTKNVFYGVNSIVLLLHPIL